MNDQDEGDELNRSDNVMWWEKFFVIYQIEINHIRYRDSPYEHQTASPPQYKQKVNDFC